MGKPNEEDKFDLLELVEITLMLTNDNFIIFVREFCSTFDCIK